MIKPLYKRTLALLLASMLLLGLCGAAFAEETADRARTVVGADLSEEQLAAVYADFGIERGSVKELRLTNAEERELLEGLVEDEKLGKYSISCVYVQLLEPFSGLEIETHNINFCTPEMYRSALLTAGITDAKIIVASPFEASGTAALAGVYKAYESITGTRLNNSAKLAGARELTTTGELAEEIGAPDAEKIISGLKDMITGSAGADGGDGSGSRIAELAERYNIQLSERQIKQLEDLEKSLEKLDVESIQEHVEQAKETVQHISEAKDKAVRFYGKFTDFLSSVSDFFGSIKKIFQ
ncbi:MAG: DUF1002 domain-containing protein [Oscillospiraceae bacterium]|nr:DUF1002 domain-containing protein [Oscillospiraceae bacterium]